MKGFFLRYGAEILFRREGEIGMTIWKLEGKEATCEIYTARGSKGGKRNPKLRYFLQLVPRQGEERILIRISKEEAEHCMSLPTQGQQIDWCAEKIAQEPSSRHEKK
jgi:hypothetical protein